MTAQRPSRQAGQQRRADARRSIEAILDAAESCLTRNPDATVAQIARAAGVGRQTLYGHFPTRADLVDAVFDEVTGRANRSLDTLETGDEPELALARLVAASWQVVHAYRGILAAAERELPRSRIREHHDRHQDRIGALLSRGRALGSFRTDVSLEWQVAVCFSLMHTAAAETMAGRIDARSAEYAVVHTIQAAVRP
jgi:AcrR family transcriptional regulator